MTLHQSFAQGAELRPLSALECDTFEVGVLAVARHFLMAASNPESMAWQRAFTISVERWGEQIGFPAAFLLASVVAAVHRVRQDDFQFQDPLCQANRQYVTEDERLLIGMLHHMRRDNTAAARQAVEVLMQGRLDPNVIRTGLSFAARFSCGAQPASGVSAKPSLSVVH